MSTGLAAGLRARWGAFLDRQHRDPEGLAGRLVGAKMVRQHHPETLWTIGLLGIRTGDTVLELGCGAGRGLALAGGRAGGGLALGVDRSATMARAAARRNRAALRAGRVAVARADLHALPLAGARFDRIFSIHTFYFWEDPERVALGLARLLAPGGVLAITLATARRDRAGAWAYWPVHARAAAVAAALGSAGVGAAALERGPDSRQYNNVAIVVRA